MMQVFLLLFVRAYKMVLVSQGSFVLFLMKGMGRYWEWFTWNHLEPMSHSVGKEQFLSIDCKMLFIQEMGSTVKWALVSDAIRGIGTVNVWKWEMGRTSFLAVGGDSDDSSADNTDDDSDNKWQ